MAELSAPSQNIVDAFDRLPANELNAATLQAIQTANPNLIPVTDPGKIQLWKMLFGTLGFVAVILAIGAVWLLLDDKETGAAILLAPVSAIVAGMFGLFAASPGS